MIAKRERSPVRSVLTPEPSTSRNQISQIISHSRQGGLHVKYQCTWTDGSLTEEKFDRIKDTQLYKDYALRCEAHNQAV